MAGECIVCDGREGTGLCIVLHLAFAFQRHYRLGYKDTAYAQFKCRLLIFKQMIVLGLLKRVYHV